MWLTTVPEYFHFIHYEVDSPEKYYALINCLREMSVSGLVRPALTMYNNFRVLSTLRQFPWEHKTEWSHLTGHERVDKILLYANEGINVKLWTGEICIRGISRKHTSVQTQAIRKKIEPFIDSLSVFEVDKQEMLQILNDEIDISSFPEDAIKNYLIGKYLGIPNNMPIAQCYWRKECTLPVHLNPDRDACGMIWLCPTVPFDGVHAKKAVDMIESVIVKHGFEPAISMQCVNERSIHIIASIAWDRQIPGEDDRAEQCYMELHIALHKEGFYFYRETTFSMVNDKATEPSSYDIFLKNIKRAIDPNCILAPGRYITS